jgi:hypothetical protein
MTPYIELLDSIIENIQENEQSWNQHDWAGADEVDLETGASCGSAFCVAGHAVLAVGAKILWKDQSWYQLLHSDNHNIPKYGATYCLYNGETQLIETVARDALGLTHNQANRLFKDTNSLDDIIDIRDELAYED